MKTKTKLFTVFTIFLTLIAGGCGSSPSSSGPDELDMAIRDASDYLNDNIPEGSMIVILNIQSDSAALSEYIIDELIANAVNDRIFKVVDRQQLDLIREEQDFQLSGEVDDNLALSIGKFFGAQIIVSGRIRQLDDRYRMTIRALDVQTAQVQGQYNRNIAAGKTITALMRSGGGTQSATARTTGSGRTTSATPSAQATPAEPTITGNAINVTSVSNWNTAINTIRNGGNDQTYIINVTGNVTVPVIDENLFGSVTGLTVTIQGNGTLSMSNTTGTLLRIGARQTIIVRDVTLRGRSGNSNNSVVRIERDGTFRMEGRASVTGNVGYGGVYINGGTFNMQDSAAVTGNTYNWVDGGGGGVSIGNNGTFIMEGGTISNNTGNSNGSGGVGVGVGIGASGGTFTMQGGTISGNTNNYGSGGVVIRAGTFTMNGGTVSGNTGSYSGGVGVWGNGTFTKTGGTIYGGNESQSLRNTSSTGSGHCIYLEGYPARWRNATAGPNDNTAGYGFWLND